MKKGLMWALVIAALSATTARAVGLSGDLINQPSLAYDQNFVVDLQAAGVNTVSADATYSSATLASKTFSDGQVSTGAITIVTAANLIRAKAVNTITVATNADIGLGTCIAYAVPGIGGKLLCQGRQWRKGSTAHLTAVAIATVLSANGLPATAGGGSSAVVYATAPANGSIYNAMPLSVSDASLTAGAALFSGGRDDAIISVNGTPFKQGVQFTAVAGDNNTTASNLATAIGANTKLASFITATPASAVITVQSKKVGALYNFTLSKGNAGAAVTLTNGNAMVGGANAAWSLSGTNIRIASHGMSTGIAALYTAGSLAIGGLTNQTTYFVAAVDANNIKLADTKAHAVAGTYITLTSSATPTAAHTYTLAPIAFVTAAATGFKWQTSTNNSSWTDVVASSVSWVSGGGAGSTSWDLGKLTPRYLRAAVIAPTTGGLNLHVTVDGSYTP
jgi:hypothetical protein